MFKFNLLDAFFQGGRNFFGAVSVPYLLSKGLTLSDLALLKMVQSGGMLLLEFPTGYLADRYGRWLSIVLGLLSGVVSFYAYIYSSGFWGFVAAEILLALALSFWSGAYDAYAIDSLGIGKNKEKLNKFYHQNSSMVSAAIIVTTLFGSVLAEANLAWTYWCSIATFFLLVIWVLMSFKNDILNHPQSHSAPRILEFARSAGTALKTLTQKHLIILTIAMIISESVLMPLIFYWQPWFLKYSGGHQGIGLGFVFIVFQVAMMIAGFYFSKISSRPFIHTTFFWISVWCLYSISMISLFWVEGYVMSMVVFCILEVTYVVGEGAMKATLNFEISSQDRASYLSFVSLLRKIGGLISLAAIGTYLSSTASQSHDDLRNVFVFTGVVCFSLFSILAILSYLRRARQFNVQGLRS